MMDGRKETVDNGLHQSLDQYYNEACSHITNAKNVMIKMDSLKMLLYMKRDVAKSKLQELVDHIYQAASNLQSCMEKEIDKAMGEKDKVIKKETNRLNGHIRNIAVECSNIEQVLQAGHGKELTEKGPAILERMRSLTTVDVQENVSDLNVFEFVQHSRALSDGLGRIGNSCCIRCSFVDPLKVEVIPQKSIHFTGSEVVLNIDIGVEDSKDVVKYLTAEVIGPGNLCQTCKITESENSHYLLSYNPLTPGVYNVFVRIYGCDIKNSPLEMGVFDKSAVEQVAAVKQDSRRKLSGGELDGQTRKKFQVCRDTLDSVRRHIQNQPQLQTPADFEKQKRRQHSAPSQTRRKTTSGYLDMLDKSQSNNAVNITDVVIKQEALWDLGYKQEVTGLLKTSPVPVKEEIIKMDVNGGKKNLFNACNSGNKVADASTKTEKLGKSSTLQGSWAPFPIQRNRSLQQKDNFPALSTGTRNVKIPEVAKEQGQKCTTSGKIPSPSSLGKIAIRLVNKSSDNSESKDRPSQTTIETIPEEDMSASDVSLMDDSDCGHSSVVDPNSAIEKFSFKYKTPSPKGIVSLANEFERNCSTASVTTCIPTANLKSQVTNYQAVKNTNSSAQQITTSKQLTPRTSPILTTRPSPSPTSTASVTGSFSTASSPGSQFSLQRSTSASPELLISPSAYAGYNPLDGDHVPPKSPASGSSVSPASVTRKRWPSSNFHKPGEKSEGNYKFLPPRMQRLLDKEAQELPQPAQQLPQPAQQLPQPSQQLPQPAQQLLKPARELHKPNNSSLFTFGQNNATTLAKSPISNSDTAVPSIRGGGDGPPTIPTDFNFGQKSSPAGSGGDGISANLVSKSPADANQRGTESGTPNSSDPESLLETHIRKYPSQDLKTRYIGQLGREGYGPGDVFRFPLGVTTNRNKDIIVCDSGNNMVKVFDWSLRRKFTLEPKKKFDKPSAVVCDDKSNIYVKDGAQIHMFNKDGTCVEAFGGQHLSRPYGLALENDQLILIDQTWINPSIVTFSVNGGMLKKKEYTPIKNSNNQGSKCRFMAVHKSRVIVSDLGRSEIYITTPAGQLIKRFGVFGWAPGNFREPSGVTVDGHGNILIADSKNDRIQVFRPDGSFVGKVQLAYPIRRPSDIHLTPDGYLLISNYLGQCVRIYQIVPS